MPPLNRQDSRPSIYSWWSDSNPLLHGPTINLHAAAKPLMRLMYHRQALNIIRQNRGSPLSSTILETYSSYFPWDYVSLSTKTAILSELADRALFSEVEARAVVDSPVFPCIVQMLVCPDPAARIWSRRLLGNLASHKSAAPAILDGEPCEQLVCLLRDSDFVVVETAMDALYEIVKRENGAQAVGNTKDLIMIFESPRPEVRKWACKVVARLASDKSTVPAILQLEPCVPLVALLSDTDSDVIRWAILALSQIARWSKGAKAIVDAGALDRVLSLLESACKIVGRPTAPAILALKLSLQVASTSIRHKDSLDAAISALDAICAWRDGVVALADMDGDVLEKLKQLKYDKSVGNKTRQQTCNVVDKIEGFKARGGAFWDWNDN